MLKPLTEGRQRGPMKYVSPNNPLAKMVPVKPPEPGRPRDEGQAKPVSAKPNSRAAE